MRVFECTSSSRPLEIHNVHVRLKDDVDGSIRCQQILDDFAAPRQVSFLKSVALTGQTVMYTEGSSEFFKKMGNYHIAMSPLIRLCNRTFVSLEKAGDTDRVGTVEYL